MKKIWEKRDIQSRPKAKAKYIGHASVLAMLFAAALPATAGAKDRITVSTYTGPWEVAQRACVLDPFTKATGIEVVAEAGTSPVTFTKLRQQKDSPTIDVAWMDAPFSASAWDEGVIQAIDPAAIPNKSNLIDEAVYTTDKKEIYAVGTGFLTFAMLYNPTVVKEPPTSWFEIWKPEYAGRVFAPGPGQALFSPFLMVINKALGGTNSNFEPVINKFRELKPSSYYDATGVLQASIQSGEVVMGVTYPSIAWQLADQGVKVAVSYPKEGLPTTEIRLHLVKGTKNKALAEKFINFALQPEPLNCLAEKISVGPPLKTPTLSEQAKQRMPWGPNGTVKDLAIPDWREIASVRQQITDLWNRRVVGR
jgi:putative spermidine/putrescine transport system substrate-binding protein